MIFATLIVSFARSIKSDNLMRFFRSDCKGSSILGSIYFNSEGLFSILKDIVSLLTRQSVQI